MMKLYNQKCLTLQPTNPKILKEDIQNLKQQKFGQKLHQKEKLKRPPVPKLDFSNLKDDFNDHNYQNIYNPNYQKQIG